MSSRKKKRGIWSKEGEERRGEEDAFDGGFGRRFVATEAGQADLRIEEHDREKGLEPLGKDLLSSERGRGEKEKSLPDTRAVSVILKKGIGLEAEVSTGEGATEQFDEKGQHGALDPASGKHHSVETGLGIGGRLSLPIEGPAEGNGAPLPGSDHQLAASDL